VKIRITDTAGNDIPDASNAITVTVSGPATLAGMDNGYQAGLESFQTPWHHAYHGLCLAIIRAKKQTGTIHVHVAGDGLKPADIELQAR
jgi:beta-galactosidase